jgi:hypothetical protein
MPYIDKAKRPAMDEDPIRNAAEVGDMTYAFSKLYYKLWKKTPRWTTYHEFRVALKHPSLIPEFEKLYIGFSSLTQFSMADVPVAAELALDEFFWKVVRKYEDGKRVANGCVFTEVAE